MQLKSNSKDRESANERKNENVKREKEKMNSSNN